MTYPNTLIFVDLATDDLEATNEFYRYVFNWVVEPRLPGFSRIVPGGHFKNPDGSDSEIGNLHIGLAAVDNRRPHPDPAGVEPRHLATGAGVRVWILVSDDDDADAILDRAVEKGATEIWRHHYWAEFNGFNNSFLDPWGNQIVLWTKPPTDPVEVPDGWTSE